MFNFAGCSTELKLVCGETIGFDVSGIFHYQEMLNGKPVYKHENKDYMLFYATWWKIDVSSLLGDEDAIGFVRTNLNIGCPEDVGAENWLYYEDHLAHSDITVDKYEGRKISPYSGIKSVVYNMQK